MRVLGYGRKQMYTLRLMQEDADKTKSALHLTSTKWKSVTVKVLIKKTL